MQNLPRLKKPPLHAIQSPNFALLLVMLIPFSISLAGMATGSGLRSWDDAFYVNMAIRFYDALCHGGPRGFLASYMCDFPGREPLIGVQAIPLFALFGRSVPSALLANCFISIVLSVFTYRFCRRFWPPAVGLAAIVVLCQFPLIAGASHAYLREYGAVALTVVTADLLAASKNLTSRRHVVLLGVLAGIGILYRILYPVYVGGLYLVAIWPRLRLALRSPERRAEAFSLLRALALIVGIGALVAFWYWRNWRHAVSFALGSAWGAVGKDYGSAHALSWAVLGPYFAGILRNGVSRWSLLILGIGLAGSGIALWRKRLRLAELLPAQGWALLGGWVIPFVIFLMGQNKLLRFIAPLLPAAAIALAVLLWGASKAFRGGSALAALVLLSGLFSIASPIYREASHGRWWQDPDIPTYRELFRQIGAIEPSAPGKGPAILLLSDTASFNCDLFQLRAEMERFPCQVYSSVRLRYSEKLLAQAAGEADYVLVKQGGDKEVNLQNPGPTLFATMQAAFEETPFQVNWSTGGKVKIWKRIQANYSR